MGPLLSIAGLTAATVALHVRDPHVSHSWGVCPLYALTGVYCPGCGGLRGVNDLSNGHLGQAASSNLLLVLAIPFAVVFFLRWSYGAWTGREVRPVPAIPRSVTTALIVLVVAFTVARNLPGSWLAP
ncbi:MAG TPA: DUF2752 domain-containing protein [Nocardioides sp.]|nr:DUF2752 domain-containing protein [Nocardioides sp.]